MGAPGPDEKIPVCVRMKRSGIKVIEQMAEEEERDRSAMIRILLKEAVAARQRRTLIK